MVKDTEIKKILEDNIKEVETDSERNRNFDKDTPDNVKKKGPVQLSSSPSQWPTSKKKSKAKKRSQKEINDWTKRDFAYYMSDLFFKRYGFNWKYNNTYITNYFGYIKESLNEVLGFCDNYVLKAYIDYFVNFWLDRFSQIGRHNYWIKKMRHEEPLAGFVSNFNYKNIVNGNDIQESEKEKTNCDISSATNSFLEELQQASMLSLDYMLLNYGLVITSNYIVMVEKRNPEIVMKRIRDVYKRLVSKGEQNKVLEKTKSLGPYPSNFMVRDFSDFSVSVLKFTANPLW